MTNKLRKKLENKQINSNNNIQSNRFKTIMHNNSNILA